MTSRWWERASRASPQADLRPPRAATVAVHRCRMLPAPIAPAPAPPRTPNCAGLARRPRSSKTGLESTSRLMPTCCDSSDHSDTSASSVCTFSVGSPPMPGGGESETLAKVMASLGNRPSDVGPDTTRSRPVRDLTSCTSRSRTRSTGAARTMNVTAASSRQPRPSPPYPTMATQRSPGGRAGLACVDYWPSVSGAARVAGQPSGSVRLGASVVAYWQPVRELCHRRGGKRAPGGFFPRRSLLSLPRPIRRAPAA